MKGKVLAMQDFSIENFVSVIYSLGILAFIVNIIVQMTQEINPIKSIPTKLYTLIISIVVCFCSLLIKEATLNIQIICTSLIGSFIVGYIAIFGYDNLFEELKRFIKK